jgi:AcrR family transcriptional regulator
LTYHRYLNTVGITVAVRLTRSQQTAATREDLLAAARRVFADRGYHAASLDEVAREAGYTKGAVYSAFGAKGRLFLAVYEREMERRWSTVEEEVEASLAAGEQRDPGERGARDFFARMQAEGPWLLALMEFRLHAARDPELNAAYAELHRAALERLAGVLRRLTDVDDAAAQEAALANMALGNGFALEHLVLPADASEERFVRASSAVAQALLTTTSGR